MRKAESGKREAEAAPDRATAATATRAARGELDQRPTSMEALMPKRSSYRQGRKQAGFSLLAMKQALLLEIASSDLTLKVCGQSPSYWSFFSMQACPG